MLEGSLREPGGQDTSLAGENVLAHGFASPRRRGFAFSGNQQSADSAANLAQVDFASKRAPAAAAPRRARPVPCLDGVLDGCGRGSIGATARAVPSEPA